ncbi:MFS transporter [Mycobacterium sp. E1715]|uniref:MFS transporter n=1 Tax=unclassified Mycobacterium TaxID=2642494 RepID=UPI000800EAE5|nr:MULTISPECIES: MFS transporter [unclassified Mycobacterium]OBG67458.1 MFS transporter [Mycobacterium sp. E188]OBG75711.1 MFS transporter [Mycobacterium sp. E3305]OBH10918.1 MFS transporter [Mycobacterium sp. E1715]OBH47073.1 MFS transporter [Mycobacterium sp. E183]
MTDTATVTGGWRQLLGARYLRTSILLAGGVCLYATNEFLTTSLLPNTIAEIGGSRLYAWVTTLYLVGSVVAAAMVNPMLLRVGARSCYLTGLAVFGTSSLVCAAAPNMEVLIAGRALQGVAGGLLAGLGYALINSALPRMLWTRGSALVSAMWGVATVVGPTTGGLFAQLGLWRWAFVAMAVLTALMGLLVPVALARVEHTPVVAPMKVPVRSLLLIGAAALAVSVAQIPSNTLATFALLAVGVALVGAFVLVDWRTHAAILPPSVFGPGPLKWIYLTMGALMGAAMVNTYVPLFGQRLAHLTPIAAGFLGAALALGWTVSEILSASLESPRTIARVIVAAPIVAASGLALAAVARRGDTSPWTAALWAIALLVAGTGIGMAWPHLSARAMSSVDDPAEGGAASAAINTVQLISAAIAAGLAGVVVNTAKGGDGMAAHWLFTVFTALCAAGVAVSYGATRPRQVQPVG